MYTYIWICIYTYLYQSQWESRSLSSPCGNSRMCLVNLYRRVWCLFFQPFLDADVPLWVSASYRPSATFTAQVSELNRALGVSGKIKHLRAFVISVQTFMPLTFSHCFLHVSFPLSFLPKSNLLNFLCYYCFFFSYFTFI